MGSLLHALPESALPCGHGELPGIADPKRGELKLRTEVGMTLRAIGHWAVSTLKCARLLLVFHIFHVIPWSCLLAFSFRHDWQILSTMVNHLFKLILNFQGKYLSIFWGLGAEFWGQNKSLPSGLSALGRPHDVTANWGNPNALPVMGMTIPSSEGLPGQPVRSLPTLVSVWENSIIMTGIHSQLLAPPHPHDSEIWSLRALSLLRPQLSRETGKLCFLHVNSLHLVASLANVVRP